MKGTPSRTTWAEPLSTLMFPTSASHQISHEDQPRSRRQGLDRQKVKDFPSSRKIVTDERSERPMKRFLWDNKKENSSLSQSNGFLKNMTHNDLEDNFPVGGARNLDQRQRFDDEGRTPRGRSRLVINPSPLHLASDQMETSEGEEMVNASDSGWSSDDDEVNDHPMKKGKEVNEIFLEQAQTLIDQVGESWKLAFDEDLNSIKTDFKNIALHVETLLSNDATLANALSKQLEINIAHQKNLRTKLIEESGEALEAAVQVQAKLNDLQKRILGITRGMEKKKQEFMRGLAGLKRAHSEGIEKMKNELATETESLRPKIQAAKSCKLEQMDNQRQLAKILAGS